MRDPTRIPDILERLKAIWEENPDLRLGQLILNSVNERMLYYTEDNQLIEALEETNSRYRIYSNKDDNE